MVCSIAPCWFENLDCTRHGRVFLPNGDVDTDQIFALLVNDGVNGNGGLTGLAVADDQFALTTPDGNHAVNSFDTGLYRRIHALAGDHARGDALNIARLVWY